VPSEDSVFAEDAAAASLSLAPSIYALLAASVAAVVAWPGLRAATHSFYCDSHAVGATAITCAIGLALVCGVFGSVALRVLRRDPRKLATALFVLAMLLSICVALVVLDSAAYGIYTKPEGGENEYGCPSFTGTTEIQSVWYLYPVWGAAVAVLLCRSVSAFRYARLQSSE
jgi:hypothetical protein